MLSVRRLVLLFLVCPPLFAQNAVVWQSLRSEEKYNRAAALYLKGQYAPAAKLYKEACDQSNPKACTDLGFMYRGGIGVRRNYRLASELYRLGCEGGNSMGCTNLGMMYWLNELPQNYKRAGDLFLRACDARDAGGCIGLAHMYENGYGGLQDAKRAAELYQQACDYGSVKACIEFSRLNAPPQAEVTSASLR